jgi:hypothetical protein
MPVPVFVDFRSFLVVFKFALLLFRKSGSHAVETGRSLAALLPQEQSCILYLVQKHIAHVNKVCSVMPCAALQWHICYVFIRVAAW